MDEVYWYEGLFLKPHHFQADAKHRGDALRTSQQWDAAYGYGIYRFELNSDSLENNKLMVTQLEARTSDRTLVRVDGPLTCDFSHALDQAPLDVYLAIPEPVAGGENGSHDGTRYQLAVTQWLDESGSSDEREDIEVRQLRCKLLVAPTSKPAPAGHETMRIARIQRSSAKSNVPSLDPDYIPPVLSIDAWRPLQTEYVRGIKDLIERRIVKWCEHGSGWTQSTRIEPVDCGPFLFLQALNQAYTALEVLEGARGVSPFELYRHLAQIAAQLAVFSPPRRLSSVPPYDHENLGAIFRQVKKEIVDRLDPFQERTLRVYFSGQADTMVARLTPDWFEPKWRWYLGVEHSPNINQNQLLDFLTGPLWYWTHASPRNISRYFQASAQGLELKQLTNQEPDLPVGNWLFFRVDGAVSPAWNNIKQEMAVALQARGHTRLADRDHITQAVRGMGDIRLRFALFAVQE